MSLAMRPPAEKTRGRKRRCARGLRRVASLPNLSSVQVLEGLLGDVGGERCVLWRRGDCLGGLGSEQGVELDVIVNGPL